MIGDVDARRLGAPAARRRSRPPCPAALSPRAAATTVAPCSASLTAIARPMPRDAPVTSATCPDEIEHQRERLDRGQIVRGAEARDRRVAVDLADQSAQDRPRTHLNIRCDALRRKAPDDRFPAHRRRHLGDSASIAPRARRASARRRRWRRSARAGPATGSARSSGARRSSAGFISAQWNGALTGSGTTRFAPERLGALAGARDGGARAGNHDLAGAVEVRGTDDLALGRLLARPRDLARRRGRGSRPSRPCRPAPPPACSGRAAARCVSASAKANVPAATLAEYSPRLWPATNAGSIALRHEQPAARRC